ncbi:MAG TPA: plastocyanin/azurin family copper-binding protein, partial [Pedobacter sp.]|nr:plastocyanin/azurin family copper-binding protein [Pedobacter sp.]
DAKTAQSADAYQISTFTYKYHHVYGSPAINMGKRVIKAIVVSEDHKKIRLVLDSLKPGYIHEIKAEGLRAEEGQLPLLHSYSYYTLNQVPDGEKLVLTTANKPIAAMAGHDHMNMGETSATTTSSASTQKHKTEQPVNWKSGAEKSIVLGTVSGLKFDQTSIVLKAGTKVKLTFVNKDDMLHNFVLTAKGAGNAVGELATKMGLDGERFNFVPNDPKILVHTVLLQPGKSDTIYFTVPEVPGDYPFICTYPGHYLVMKGVLKVVK